MIRRELLTDLELWAKKSDRKPLVLRGARQVGKSTLVEEFAKQYDVYLKLNLEKTFDADLFERYNSHHFNAVAFAGSQKQKTKINLARYRIGQLRG